MVESNRFEELCAAYVLGALEEGETNEFERALAQATPEQKAHFKRARQTSMLLSTALDPIEPRPLVKEQLMQRIAGRPAVTAREETPSMFERFFGGFRFAAPALAMAAAVVFFWIQNSDLRSSLRQQSDQIALQTDQIALQGDQIARLQQKSADDAELFAFLTSAQLEVASMQGLDPSPSSSGKVYWDKSTGEGWVQFRDLPAPPTDRDYQLWLIIAGKPVSAGVFTFTDTRGGRYFKLAPLNERDPANIQAFAVTLEPKGGVESPSGAMYLKGTI